MTAGDDMNVENSCTSCNVHADTKLSNSSGGVDKWVRVSSSMERLVTSSVISETDTMVCAAFREDDLED